MCEIGKSGTAGSPDKTVVIQWDNGTRTNYRVGYMGKYDLRVIDNAQIGKNHHTLCRFEQNTLHKVGRYMAEGLKNIYFIVNRPFGPSNLHFTVTIPS